MEYDTDDVKFNGAYYSDTEVTHNNVRISLHEMQKNKNKIKTKCYILKKIVVFKWFNRKLHLIILYD